MWIIYVIICIALWGITDVLYKKGARKEEKYIPLKFSIVIGLIFFLIALVYLITRDEPFTIWESAVRFWPVTIFGIVYAIVNTISFNCFLYNPPLFFKKTLDKHCYLLTVAVMLTTKTLLLLIFVNIILILMPLPVLPGVSSNVFGTLIYLLPILFWLLNIRNSVLQQ